MQVYAIDPGPTQSAYVVWDGRQIFTKGIVLNEILLNDLRTSRDYCCDLCPVAVEMIASYGMAVGKETFETCVMIGRIAELCHDKRAFHRVYRKDVKMHLCQSMRAKDSNVRQALVDKHGLPGTKKAPGRLYGIGSHLWAALAVADYWIVINK
jgi:hypothetical protein